MGDSSRKEFESCIEYRIYNPEKVIEELGNTFCLILRETVNAKIKAEAESPTFPASVKTNLLNGKLTELSEVLGALKDVVKAKLDACNKAKSETQNVPTVENPQGWDKIENTKQE